jgi:sulfur-oxidizing protein SoxY
MVWQPREGKPMTAVSAIKHNGWTWETWLISTLTLLFLSFDTTKTWSNEDSSRWFEIKTSLFGDKGIDSGEDILRLETPVRAMDAAIVPISIESKIKQSPQRHIKRLYLIIDNNPSPVAAVFRFPGKHDWKTLSTRVRINAYTDLRAIAELNDGKLYMVNNYVKASGGCSAPSLKDPAAAAAQLGKIKFRIADDYQQGDLVSTQLMIKHPNNSGLQFDQVSRFYIPADFIRAIEVTYNGEQVFSADTDISISEDPSIRFGFSPQERGVLKVHVKDSKGRSFAHSIELPTKGENFKHKITTGKQ